MFKRPVLFTLIASAFRIASAAEAPEVIVVHDAIVGPINEVRSIITGWYRVPGAPILAKSAPDLGIETEQKA